MSDPPEVSIFPSAAAFRRWLEEHHAAVAELWVGYYKKGVAKVSMTYPESVDEALCFGWIDGLTRRIDDEVYTIRFTPRRATSNWSAINIAKVAQLTAAGRMHAAGRRAFDARDRRKDPSAASQRARVTLPSEWMERLQADPAARATWDAETPSFRRGAAAWVMAAKRPETRTRRFETLISDIAAGRRPKPFIVERADSR